MSTPDQDDRLGAPNSPAERESHGDLATGGGAEQMLFALLKPYVRADAIPQVVRRSVAELGGRSLLEAADDGDIEAVRVAVRSMFDLRRVQP